MINKILYNLYHNLQSIITWIFWGYVSVLLSLYLVNIELNTYLFVILFFLFGLWIGSCLSYWLRSELKDRDLE
ncbi:hypothetical protein [uncultured Bacteroides sp.]|uniref:hypothetical protein n=1 Tax=uncultured Bacteroides sp. TaxID=162156 RepID=UPI002AABE26E|nr:hypothetical protein [uncultured Bacteroides sp.]